jgi:hypothetical protein
VIVSDPRRDVDRPGRKAKRFLSAMYLRFTQRANADGSVVRYVALAHNRRVNGKVKPDVLMNLGRVDGLDVDGLRRLAASITSTSARTARA